MQFSIALLALVGTAFAADGILAPRQNPAACSSINSCITTHGNPASASAFCASYNSQATTTTTTTVAANPTDCVGDVIAVKRQVVQVLAPQKPRCLKKKLDGNLSKACSCVVTEATTTMTETESACPTL